ncbi:carbohydrate kinase [Cellulomonas shaoxiangyii]|uniref:Carbohydrate kinase n=1 Tax=Cellulomonas shaoxiangyii TaxID=2566013 RepID=A0A4P7SMW0_9CELL|nr:carbohydrate kinase [Cellulomonas shaoxiangyii]TGY77736.1 carbohydrate kinase [Cellulomonas shaoxiangyii]
MRTARGSGALVCCGLTTLDVQQTVEAVPGPDEKVVASDLEVTFGGPAANAAAVAVALGVPTRLVTALGTGPLADVARAGLAAAGVDVVDVAAGRPDVLPVSTVLVTRATGARAVASVNGTRAGGVVPAGPVDALLDGAAVVLVDGHLAGVATAVAAAARAAGVPVLLDGGSWKPGTAALLAHVDLAVLSADFALPAEVGQPAHGGARVPDEDVDALLDAVAAYGPGFVARSAGPGPVRVRSILAGGDGVRRSVVRPARLVPGAVVDTVGAGDVLHGAMAAALVRGAAPLPALAEGVRCATLSVEHRGARGWLAALRGAPAAG